MPQINYFVNSGEYFTHWLLSSVIETPFVAKMLPTVFEDYHPGVSVKDKKGKEIVSPAKKEFLLTARFEKSGYPEGIPMEKPYIPFDTTRVDCSNFWDFPHDITFYAKTFIETDVAETHCFEIGTCGAVKIWVNGVETSVFSPYEANIEEKMKINLSLQKGVNEIVVGCNNYGERNIIFNFGLKNFGQNTKGFLTVDADVEKMRQIQDSLSSLYVENMRYSQGPVYFCADTPFALPCTLNTEVCGIVKVVDVKKGDSRILWGEVSDLPMGYHEFKVRCEIDGVVLLSTLWAEVDAPDMKTPEKYEDRVTAVIDFIAANAPLCIERYIACLAKGENPSAEYRKILGASMFHVKNRGDCSDFHVIKMMWLIYKFRDALPPEQVSECEDILLGFRYWFDEKGNDAMWFFSENHALGFHVGEILAGQMFPDKIFPNSGIIGSEHVKKAKALILEWFNKLFAYGYNEWNSSAYIPVDMLCYISLYALCADEEIRRLSGKALDYTYEIFAKNSFHGVLGTSSGRAYPRQLLANKNLETNPLLWLAWGCGCLNANPSPVIFIAMSGYRPPEGLRQIASWDKKKLFVDEDLQGYVSCPVPISGQPEYVRVPTILCKTKDYILGTCRSPRTGWLGSQEHLINIFLKDEECRIWVNHPGEGKIFGTKRPGYFTGNGLTPLVSQYKNVAVVSYNFIETLLNRAEVGFTHAFCDISKCDEFVLDGNWAFARRGDAYVAVYSSNSLSVNKKPPLKDKELLSPGINGTWFIKVSAQGEIDSFCAFVDYMKHYPPTVCQDKLYFKDYGFGELEFDLMQDGGRIYV